MTLGFHVNFPGCSDFELKKDLIFGLFGPPKNLAGKGVFFLFGRNLCYFLSGWFSPHPLANFCFV